MNEKLDDKPMRRWEAAEFLTERGYPISKATLGTMAHHGNGPPMRYWNRLPIYDAKTLLAWAKHRAGPAVTVTRRHKVKMRVVK